MIFKTVAEAGDNGISIKLFGLNVVLSGEKQIPIDQGPTAKF